MKTITYFSRKSFKFNSERHNFACDNYIFLKQVKTKSKEWTHYSALKQYTKWKTLNHFMIIN